MALILSFELDFVVDAVSHRKQWYWLDQRSSENFTELNIKQHDEIKSLKQNQSNLLKEMEASKTIEICKLGDYGASKLLPF